MAFKMHEIRELIRLIDESQIEEFEIDNEGAKVIIKKAIRHKMEEVPTTLVMPAPVSTISEPTPPISSTQPLPTKSPTHEVSEPVDAEDGNLHKIVSPMVGTFYRAPSPDSDPYVKEGDQVNDTTIVCIVEAMKLMNEIEAETRGTIVKTLVENGQLVEYGQPLFLVKS